MSSAIGYVETVREDLLDAAWRTTMSSPRRASRRRPSTRWVVAGATVFTLLASGVIGWRILDTRPYETRAMIATAPRDHIRATDGSAVPAASPAVTAADREKSNGPVAAGGRFGGNESTASADLAAAPGGAGARYAVSTPIRPSTGLSKVIKTGRMSIVVTHGAFGDRFTQIGDIADRLGGYISSSSTSGGKSGFVTMRIPARRFQEALRSLRQLGRVESEDVHGRDVTADYVDLRARTHIARARRTVLLRLMDRATSIEQTIRVQNALDDVQLRIEELQGQLNVLNDEVDEATIRVSIRETGVKANAGADVENPSIGNAFDHAVAGFFSVVSGVIVGLGWVIPALVVLLVLWLVVARVRRRLA